MSTKLGVEFEREALQAARTCFVCKQQFATVTTMETHRQKAHPDHGRLHIEWNARMGKWA